MYLFKQNEATPSLRQVPIVMIDSTDHVTPKTGLSPTVQIKKAGATNFSNIAGTVAEVGSGWYNINLAQSDLDTLGIAALKVTAPGADQQNLNIQVVPWNPYDADSLGLSNLNATVGSRATPADILVNPATDKIRGSWLDKPVSAVSALHSHTDAYISAPLTLTAIGCLAQFRLVQGEGILEIAILCQHPEPDSQNRYFLYVTGISLELYKNVNGAITQLWQTNQNSGDSWHSVILQRESNGDLVVWYDGQLKCTVNDTSITSGNYIGIGLWDRVEVKSFDIDDRLSPQNPQIGDLEWTVKLGDVFFSPTWFQKRLQDKLTKSDFDVKVPEPAAKETTAQAIKTKTDNLPDQPASKEDVTVYVGE